MGDCIEVILAITDQCFTGGKAKTHHRPLLLGGKPKNENVNTVINNYSQTFITNINMTKAKITMVR